MPSPPSNEALPTSFVKRGRPAVCRDAEPDRWGVAVCTTDGQMFLEGHTDDYFSIQSSSKPLTYAMALKECGEEKVHSYVGAPATPRRSHAEYICRTSCTWYGSI